MTFFNRASLQAIPLRWLTTLMLLGSGLAVAACDQTPDCYQGDYLACSCSDAERGYQTCGEDSTYQACVCDGITPGLGGADSSGTGGVGGAGGSGNNGGSSSGGKLPFMSECEDNRQCETDLCYVFNAKGPRCTKPCTTPTDCPPPSPGCNNMGICKAP